jgi:hypothetical protein
MAACTLPSGNTNTITLGKPAVNNDSGDVFSGGFLLINWAKSGYCCTNQ